MTASAVEPWDAGLALHQAVLNACDRITDRGLRVRVLVAEAGHLSVRLDAEIAREHLERRRQAENVAEICARPWQDEYGLLHCASCGGYAEPVPSRAVGKRCSCPIVIEAGAA